MTEMGERQFFTWYYPIGFNSHSLTVLARNREEAVTRLLQSLKANQVLDLHGPYTTPLSQVVASGIRPSYDKAPMPVEEFLRQTEPQVTNADCVIAVSALDG
jgi:hypothetical protein